MSRVLTNLGLGKAVLINHLSGTTWMRRSTLLERLSRVACTTLATATTVSETTMADDTRNTRNVNSILRLYCALDADPYTNVEMSGRCAGLASILVHRG